MKLADVNLSNPQTMALLRILDREVQAEETRRNEADQEASRSEVYDQHYEKLTKLARDWARKNGNIEGMPAMQMASATWETFQEGDGWFSSMDIDDHFQADDDDWRESWETAYVSECYTIAREKGK